MLYAEYNGSAPLHPEVKTFLHERLNQGVFANPNTSNGLGAILSSKLEQARYECAQVLGASPENIIFCSGASEGISSIFHHVLENVPKTKNIIIVSSIEHSAVIKTAEHYETKGFTVKYLPASKEGIVDVAVLKDWLTQNPEKIALVSVMAANNETGVIQPYEQIVSLCRQHKVEYFSDTTQFIGKTSFHFEKSGMDYAVLSGHKIGALIGSGLILIKNKKKFLPMIHGGGQEEGLRGGTQNYIATETMAVALKAFQKEQSMITELSAARNDFEIKIKADFPELEIIGAKSARLAGTTLMALPGHLGAVVQMELEKRKIYVSTSSACSDSAATMSKVLKAMNISESIGRGVIRCSFGHLNAKANYEALYLGLKDCYQSLIGRKAT